MSRKSSTKPVARHRDEDLGVTAVEPSDAALVAAVRAGDEAAYGELWKRHESAARRLARQISNPSNTDDLVSESFLKVLRALKDGGGPDGAFRPYLFSTLRRVNIDNGRSYYQRVALTEDDDDLEVEPSPSAADVAHDLAENSAAWRAWNSLPESSRTLLWHLVIEEETPAQIAPLIGTTPNGVSSRAVRAKERLRQAFLQQHLLDADNEQCRRTRIRLGEYVRNALSARDRAEVQAHLDECDRCRAALLDVTEVNGSLRAFIAPIVLGGSVVAGKYLVAGGAGKAAAGFGWLHWLRHAEPSKLVGTAAASVVVVAAATTAIVVTGSHDKHPQAQVPTRPHLSSSAPGARPTPSSAPILIVPSAPASSTKASTSPTVTASGTVVPNVRIDQPQSGIDASSAGSTSPSTSTAPSATGSASTSPTSAPSTTTTVPPPPPSPPAATPPGTVTLVQDKHYLPVAAGQATAEYQISVDNAGSADWAITGEITMTDPNQQATPCAVSLIATNRLSASCTINNPQPGTYQVTVTVTGPADDTASTFSVTSTQCTDASKPTSCTTTPANIVAVNPSITVNTVATQPVTIPAAATSPSGTYTITVPSGENWTITGAALAGTAGGAPIICTSGNAGGSSFDCAVPDPVPGTSYTVSITAVGPGADHTSIAYLGYHDGTGADVIPPYVAFVINPA